LILENEKFTGQLIYANEWKQSVIERNNYWIQYFYEKKV
jgi:hypothetical protein